MDTETINFSQINSYIGYKIFECEKHIFDNIKGNELHSIETIKDYLYPIEEIYKNGECCVDYTITELYNKKNNAVSIGYNDIKNIYLCRTIDDKISYYKDYLIIHKFKTILLC